MTATADAVTTILAAEFVELRHGGAQMEGTIKRARQLMGSLKLDPDALGALDTQRKALLALLADEAKRCRVPEDLVPVGRVAVSLRHGTLVRLRADEKKKGVEENVDVTERISVCETLGEKFGLQLDLVHHTEDDGEGEE